MIVKRCVLTFALALAIAGQSALGIGGTTPVLARDELASTAADSTPMLEALSLLPPGIDAFEFTHWSAAFRKSSGSNLDGGAWSRPAAERCSRSMMILKREWKDGSREEAIMARATRERTVGAIAARCGSSC
jgi:hypothetical protein